ncbi:MAG: hypothetical protein A3C07_04340 [Candidatus Sungbacteria bacterium RIFCSPHIGHO2_02_FULL_47_11]|uniref:Uncharacterized protein n=1 Tax=Candidatus Sungbacteria bacterium RIFCSPHIGHO2_02_FULL_47_11 TaxID=1802270 RepID=A0A1G2KMN1_9BACT|nr:MAG: hypothetical protein A3C07_04340 [Candidatus Sungbacteria bacterium RIFCSPHIGHO2_02_FULL_47_11]
MKTKKRTSKAEQVRELAKEMLLIGEMNFRKLAATVKGKLGPVREDFIKSSLTVRSSGVGLYGETGVLIVRRLGTQKPSPRLTPEQFVLRAIETLSTARKKYILAHASGFRVAFRRYFKVDPDAEVKKT